MCRYCCLCHTTVCPQSPPHPHVNVNMYTLTRTPVPHRYLWFWKQPLMFIVDVVFFFCFVVIQCVNWAVMDRSLFFPPASAGLLM